jgi:hypothetical protein
MEVHQPHPPQSVDALEATQQRHQVPLAGIAAPHDRVLAHERELGHSELDKAACLVFDHVGRARHELPAHQRYRAESTPSVAALRDL